MVVRHGRGPHLFSSITNPARTAGSRCSGPDTWSKADSTTSTSSADLFARASMRPVSSRLDELPPTLSFRDVVVRRRLLDEMPEVAAGDRRTRSRRSRRAAFVARVDPATTSRSPWASCSPLEANDAAPDLDGLRLRLLDAGWSIQAPDPSKSPIPAGSLYQLFGASPHLYLQEKPRTSRTSPAILKNLAGQRWEDHAPL